MAYDYAAQDALNRKHAANPSSGDYWHEVFSPQFLVVKNDGKWVTYISAKTHRIDVDRDHWTWNTDKPALAIEVEKFAELVRYKSGVDGHWADVVPAAKNHAWAVQLMLPAIQPEMPNEDQL